MAFNPAQGSGQQTTYSQGNGLGTIYQYGHQTPYGPFTGLPVAGAPGATGGTSTSTATSGPTGAAQTFLNGVLSGDKLPYSPDRINQMYSQASDQNASAEGALNARQDQTAAAGGASASDPSRNGAKLNTMAARQTANATSKRDINQTATGANFDSQLKAASMLEESRRQSEALAAGVQRQAMGYMPWNQGGGGGAQQQQSGGGYGYTSNDSSNRLDPASNGAGPHSTYTDYRHNGIATPANPLYLDDWANFDNWFLG